jgi:predicted PurR-regulated permease PerM
VGLVAIAIAVLLPRWAPLVFAAWTAAILDPVASRIARAFGDRRPIGAGATVVLVASTLVPLVLLVVSLSESVAEFGQRLLASPEARHALLTAVSTDGAPSADRFELKHLVDLAREHGATAWQALGGLVGASAWAAASALVFFVALYDFLAEGRALWEWARSRLPLSPSVTRRLGDAFLETGKGLFVGGGLTALAQALLATAFYAALGVPRLAVLGALTFVAAFVPTVGTAIVWGPIAIGLALSGEVARAVILVVLGLFGVGTIDNVLRPVFQRWGGHLDLPASVLLFAAFGGLAAFGPAGLALGPLALRLAREILEIARETRLAHEPLGAVPLDAVPLDAVPLDAVPLDAVPLDAVPLENERSDSDRRSDAARTR